MSIAVTTRVWKQSQHSGSDLLMLLAIADFADDEGSAFPTIETLANKARIKRNSARKVLKRLVSSGELEIDQGKGATTRSGQHTNRYTIQLERLGLVKEGDDDPLLDESQEGDDHHPLGNKEGDDDPPQEGDGDTPITVNESVTNNQRSEKDSPAQPGRVVVSFFQHRFFIAPLILSMSRLTTSRIAHDLRLDTDDLYQAIAQVWSSGAPGFLSNVASMMRSKSKTGDWADCNFLSEPTPDQVIAWGRACGQYLPQTPWKIQKSFDDWLRTQNTRPEPEPIPIPVDNPSRPEYPYSNLTEEQHQQLDDAFSAVLEKWGA